MTDPTNNSNDILKKPGRRNWLRNAAMAATGALMLLLVLTGCTKEQWDHLKNTPTGGGLGGTQDTWYRLKVTYKDENNVAHTAYLGAAGGSYGETDWDNMVMGGYDRKFKLYPAGDGYDYWEISDGYWLSMRLSGWAYRSFYGQRIGWKIVDGKLYNSYWYPENWQDHPMGADWREGVFTSKGYYMGVDLGADKVLTNCVLEAAP